MKRNLAAIIFCGSMVLLWIVALAFAIPAHATTRAEGQGQRSLFHRVNHVRAQHHLPPLRYSPVLASRARQAGARTTRTGKMIHVLPARPSSAIGETLGLFGGHWTKGSTLVVRAWLRSPAHRPVLLSRSFRYLGVGVVARHGRTAYVAEYRR